MQSLLTDKVKYDTLLQTFKIMAKKRSIYNGKSKKYKHVYGIIRDGRQKWRPTYRGWSGNDYDSEKEAAMMLDIRLITLDEEPVSVLRRK